MMKRLGCGQFSLGKLLRGCGHCQGETLPMETGKKKSKIKQISVKCNKQEEENKEKRNRAELI